MAFVFYYALKCQAAVIYYEVWGTSKTKGFARAYKNGMSGGWIQNASFALFFALTWPFMMFLIMPAVFKFRKIRNEGR